MSVPVQAFRRSLVPGLHSDPELWFYRQCTISDLTLVWLIVLTFPKIAVFATVMKVSSIVSGILVLWDTCDKLNLSPVCHNVLINSRHCSALIGNISVMTSVFELCHSLHLLTCPSTSLLLVVFSLHS